MFILYVLFTIICCFVTAILTQRQIVRILKERDEQNLELIEQLSDYIYENKKQIQENVHMINQLIRTNASP